MKIIGSTANGFILEASRDEVANLVGHYGPYTDGFRRMELQPGDDIRVAEMFRRLYDLAHNTEALSEVAKTLRMVAEICEQKAPIVFGDAPKGGGA